MPLRILKAKVESISQCSRQDQWSDLPLWRCSPSIAGNQPVCQHSWGQAVPASYYPPLPKPYIERYKAQNCSSLTILTVTEKCYTPWLWNIYHLHTMVAETYQLYTMAIEYLSNITWLENIFYQLHTMVAETFYQLYTMAMGYLPAIHHGYGISTSYTPWLQKPSTSYTPWL